MSHPWQNLIEQLVHELKKIDSTVGLKDRVHLERHGEHLRGQNAVVIGL